MKKKWFILFFLFILFISKKTLSQTIDNTNTPISITPFISSDVNTIPYSVVNILNEKISQILTGSNIVRVNNNNGRFIMTAHVLELDKGTTSTIPIMYTITLQVSFYIGDGILGVKLISKDLPPLKGVGTSLERAYILALKNLKTNNALYQAFLENAKDKILNYSDEICQKIVTTAQTLSNNSGFDDAIAILTSINEVPNKCIIQINTLINKIYQQKLDYDGYKLLQQANNVWSINEDETASTQAMDYINKIDPQSSSFNQAKMLVDIMATKLKKDREALQAQMQQAYNDQISLQKKAIDAIKEIEVARSKGVTYNIVSW